MRPRVLKGVVKALSKVMEVLKVVKPLPLPSTTNPSCKWGPLAGTAVFANASRGVVSPHRKGLFRARSIERYAENPPK